MLSSEDLVPAATRKFIFPNKLRGTILVLLGLPDGRLDALVSPPLITHVLTLVVVRADIAVASVGVGCPDVHLPARLRAT